MSSIWNPQDRYILANGAVSANAPLSGDGSNSQPLGLDLKTDNSLSGNGTLTSPLGVVPGYNETVLWSGALTTGHTATLDENITNFERIAFEGYCHNGINYPCRAEAPVLNLEMHMMGLTYWPGEKDFVTCDITANNKVSTRGTYVEAGSTVNTFDATITKIIGINRKQ